MKNLSFARSSTTWSIQFVDPFFDGTHSLFFFGKIKFVLVLISHEPKKEKFEIRALFYYPIKTLYGNGLARLANHKSLFRMSHWGPGLNYFSERKNIKKLKSWILPFPISDEVKWFFEPKKVSKLTDWSPMQRSHACRYFVHRTISPIWPHFEQFIKFLRDKLSFYSQINQWKNPSIYLKI